MHQSQARRAAGGGQCSGRDVMHLLVRFSAALTQDADAVQDGIDALKQRLPIVGE